MIKVKLKYYENHLCRDLTKPYDEQVCTFIPTPLIFMEQQKILGSIIQVELNSVSFY